MGFVIDHHIINYVEIAGLALGVLGSLYLTYDLLGRSRSPLRWLLRLTMPGLLGALILAPAGGAEFYGFYTYINPVVPSNILGEVVIQGVILYALVGAMIGMFNGLFVDAPGSVARSRFFSVADALVGAIIAFLVWFLAILVFNGPVTLALEEGLILAPTGALAGGIWTRVNHERAASNERPRFFSRRGVLIGFVSALFLGSASAFLSDVTLGANVLNSLRGALLGAVLIGGAGALTGGLSRFVFWWANDLPGRTLGAIGVTLTLVGFLVQLVQPVVSALDIPIR